MEQPRATICVYVETRDDLKKVAEKHGFNRIATYLSYHARKELKKENKKK